MYEEVSAEETAIYPGFYAQFVDEQGKAFTNSLTLSENYTEFLRKISIRLKHLMVLQTTSKP
ncbi:Hypothetical protein ABNV54_02273 [Enterococcus faecalis]